MVNQGGKACCSLYLFIYLFSVTFPSTVSPRQQGWAIALDFQSPRWKQQGKAALTLICALALLSSPSVVCRVQSGPSGIRTFKRSRHRRRWARLQGENRRIRAMLSARECHFFHYCPPTRQFSGFPVSMHHKIPLRYQYRLPLNYLHFKHQLLTNTCIIANLWQTLFILLLSELIIWLIWMNFVEGQRYTGKWYKYLMGFHSLWAICCLFCWEELLWKQFWMTATPCTLVHCWLRDICYELTWTPSFWVKLRSSMRKMASAKHCNNPCWQLKEQEGW